MKIIVGGGGGGSMWASRNIYVPRSSSNVFSRALHNAFYNLREREKENTTLTLSQSRSQMTCRESK